MNIFEGQIDLLKIQDNLFRGVIVLIFSRVHHVCGQGFASLETNLLETKDTSPYRHDAESESKENSPPDPFITKGFAVESKTKSRQDGFSDRFSGSRIGLLVVLSTLIFIHQQSTEHPSEQIYMKRM